MLLREESKCGDEELTSAECDIGDWRSKIEEDNDVLWRLTAALKQEHSHGSVSISALENGNGDTQIYLECTSTTSWAYKAIDPGVRSM